MIVLRCQIRRKILRLADDASKVIEKTLSRTLNRFDEHVSAFRETGISFEDNDAVLNSTFDCHLRTPQDSQ